MGVKSKKKIEHNIIRNKSSVTQRGRLSMIAAYFSHEMIIKCRYLYLKRCNNNVYT